MTNNAFLSIFQMAPSWVWAILAFLVYRGIVMSKDREVKLRSFLILPVVMVIWSFSSVFSASGLMLSMTAWFIGLGVAAVVTKQATRSDQIIPSQQVGMIWVKGSWVPMMLMMSIFVGKFAWNVSLVVVEGLKQNSLAWAISSLVFGAMSGVFLGRALKALNITANNETLGQVA